MCTALGVFPRTRYVCVPSRGRAGLALLAGDAVLAFHPQDRSASRIFCLLRWHFDVSFSGCRQDGWQSGLRLVSAPQLPAPQAWQEVGGIVELQGTPSNPGAGTSPRENSAASTQLCLEDVLSTLLCE